MLNKSLIKIKKFFYKKSVRKTGLIFTLCSLLLVLSYSFYSLAYAQKFYPGVKIGNLSLAGLDRNQTRDLLEKKISQIRDQDLKLEIKEREWLVRGEDLKVKYDLEQTLDRAWSLGHEKSLWANFKTRVGLIFRPKNLFAVFSYNQKEVDRLLDQISSQIEVRGNDATLEIKEGKVEIIQEKIGKEIKKDILDQRLKQKIGYLDSDRKVEIPLEIYQPKLVTQDLLVAQKEVTRIIRDKIILKGQSNHFEIDSQTIGSWLEFATTERSRKPEIGAGFGRRTLAQEGRYSFSYFFNQDKIKAYIETLAGKINQDPVDAKLTIANGRAVVFQASKDGYQLDQERTLSQLELLLSERRKVAGVSTENPDPNHYQEIELTIKTKKPAISDKTINDLGIKEMIGKGTTSFAGSPENRKYNIHLGASIFNGVLIKPGENFSFLKSLGDVSEARGFRKELVIKEDRTEPEIGGGLCQVSTTIFRAALNSGMEILERTNHKYRVSYYEPPIGLDATVYEPSPDLKFKNNTPGYILIQGKISGNYLTFEFYGTKDGRKVEISEPRVYDLVSPKEPLYIEDPSLAPGEEKRLEQAHDGAKAEFHYKVISKTGEILFEKTFYSKYVAWRAVYLRGPARQESPPSQEEPTPSPIETPTP